MPFKEYRIYETNIEFHTFISYEKSKQSCGSNSGLEWYSKLHPILTLNNSKLKICIQILLYNFQYTIFVISSKSMCHFFKEAIGSWDITCYW